MKKDIYGNAVILSYIFGQNVTIYWQHHACITTTVPKISVVKVAAGILTHSLTLTYLLTFTHSLTHSLTHSPTLTFSLTHSYLLTLTHSLTSLLTHSLTKGVIFLSGSIVESLKEPENELKGYYGFEILHLDLCTGVHHRHDKRTLYARSAEERDRWVTTLQHAANVIPIEEEYCIGLELGRGRFSIVKECVHKTSGKHYAVKIIDKSTIEQEYKSLLRTEIAVLKLVNHPNIIHMEGLYESRQHIYIVMEMLKGADTHLLTHSLTLTHSYSLTLTHLLTHFLS